MMFSRIDNYDWQEAFGFGNGGRTYKDRGDGSEDYHVPLHYNTHNSGVPVPAKPKDDVPLDPVFREDVIRIHAIVDGIGDEQDWIGLFKLKDGRFATVVAGCDYTGWD